jgi:hypothetical protein
LGAGSVIKGYLIKTNVLKKDFCKYIILFILIGALTAPTYLSFIDLYSSEVVLVTDYTEEEKSKAETDFKFSDYITYNYYNSDFLSIFFITIKSCFKEIISKSITKEILLPPPEIT